MEGHAREKEGCQSSEGTVFVLKLTTTSPTTKGVTEYFHAALMLSKNRTSSGTMSIRKSDTAFVSEVCTPQKE